MIKKTIVALVRVIQTFDELGVAINDLAAPETIKTVLTSVKVCRLPKARFAKDHKEIAKVFSSVASLLEILVARHETLSTYPIVYPQIETFKQLLRGDNLLDLYQKLVVDNAATLKLLDFSVPLSSILSSKDKLEEGKWSFARDLKTNRDVSALLLGPNDGDNFRRYKQILSTVKHSTIPKLVAAIETEEYLLIQAERFEGGP